MPSGTSTRPAVILGLAAAGLAPLRVLGAMGVPCLGLYRDPRKEMGRCSRYLARSRRVSAAPSHDELLAALDELTAPWRDTMPVLIPASDIYAAFVDELQDELRPRYTIRCARRRLRSAFVDKVTTLELCNEVGVSIPRSLALATQGELTSIAREFRFPVIVKPRRSYGIAFPGKNFVADRAETLHAFFDEYPALLDRVVVQEMVRGGDGHIVMVISYSGEEGRVLSMATLRKLRQWPPDRGVTSFGRSDWLPEAASITRGFLDHLGYQGFAATELVEDVESGRLQLLEVNPRLSLPTRLVLDAGVDLVGTAWREMTGGTPGARGHVGGPQVEQVHWMDLHRDLLSMIDKSRRGQIRLSSWVRSLLRVRSHAVFDWRDPRPWLLSSRELVRDLGSLLGRYLWHRFSRRA
jgi:predicted ATP-grasp superfamily ATP-dependent carboligase